MMMVRVLMLTLRTVGIVAKFHIGTAVVYVAKEMVMIHRVLSVIEYHCDLELV